MITQERGPGIPADFLTETQKQRLLSRLVPAPSGCWEFQGASTKRYGVVNVGSGRKRRTMLAHRAMWAITHGHVPDDLHVCHTCDNPPCCNPDHLFLGTDFDNVQDCIAKGRKTPPPHPSGEQNNRAKLSDADVVDIRERFVRNYAPRKTGGGYRSNAHELADEFGVTDANIRMIIRGVTRS